MLAPAERRLFASDGARRTQARKSLGSTSRRPVRYTSMTTPKRTRRASRSRTLIISNTVVGLTFAANLRGLHVAEYQSVKVGAECRRATGRVRFSGRVRQQALAFLFRREVSVERKVGLFPIFNREKTNTIGLQMLQLPPDKVHDDAKRLEGVATTEVG